MAGASWLLFIQNLVRLRNCNPDIRTMSVVTVEVAFLQRMAEAVIQPPFSTFRERFVGEVGLAASR
jgi:hypothetical protein